MLVRKVIAVECSMDEREAGSLYDFLNIFDDHIERIMEENYYTQEKADELRGIVKAFSGALLLANAEFVE